MIRFISFSFGSDKFYTQKTTIPLGVPGLTLFRGTNYDAVAKDESDPTNTPSNGTGKTRLGQILEGFIYGKTARGNFKKMVAPDFEGTLEFEDLRTKTHWSFYFCRGEWLVKKNDVVLDAISHKASDVQGFLQQTIGISREEWSYFVQIDGDSLRTLIKGKPAERRAYLEEFFNIDAYYIQQLDLYKQKLRQVGEELRLIEQDQVRLNDVEAALEKLPGALWLERQLEFLKEISSLLQRDLDASGKEAEKVRSHLATWQEYQRLLVKYEDFEVLREEEKQRLEEARLQELRAKVEQQNRLKQFLVRELNPHKSKRPQNIPAKPEEPEPSPQSITDKKVMLSQMTDKMAVKQSLRDLMTRLPEIPSGVTLESLEAERGQAQKLKVEWEHQLSVIEKTHGRGECPTCGQSLPESIKGETPDRAKAQIASLKQEIQRIDGLLLTLREYAKKDQEISFLKKKLDSFPVFGLTLPAVKKEIEDLEALASQWVRYRKVTDQHQEWLARDRELEAEARVLGYPQILEESFSEELAKLSESVRVRSQALKESQELKRLVDIVMTLPPYQSLNYDLDRLQNETIPELKEKIVEAAQLLGSYSFQLRQRKDLLQQRERLYLRVQNFEKLKGLSRKLEVAADFYAPSGFKLYELKQRCKLLVERANYWSKVFFQEPYVWSLSEDLDDLNLFVTPTNLKKEDPYPVALLSAGERNRAARVLLFAQLELIPPTKKTNLLFLDEIEANLDETGIKAFVDVAIPKLKETFPERSIVIVSHLKGLKSSGHFDHLWLAERRERKTKLTTYPWYHRKFSVGEPSVAK